MILHTCFLAARRSSSRRSSNSVVVKEKKAREGVVLSGCIGWSKYVS